MYKKKGFQNLRGTDLHDLQCSTPATAISSAYRPRSILKCLLPRPQYLVALKGIETSVMRKLDCLAPGASEGRRCAPTQVDALHHCRYSHESPRALRPWSQLRTRRSWSHLSCRTHLSNPRAEGGDARHVTPASLRVTGGLFAVPARRPQLRYHPWSQAPGAGAGIATVHINPSPNCDSLGAGSPPPPGAGEDMYASQSPGKVLWECEKRLTSWKFCRRPHDCSVLHVSFSIAVLAVHLFCSGFERVTVPVPPLSSVRSL
jgi:hypothetical protein